MRAWKRAALIAGSLWAFVKGVQWVMIQALGIAATGLALWWVIGVVTELV